MVGVSGVAEGDADVAKESSPFGAVDWGVAKALFEGGFIELGPILEGELVEFWFGVGFHDLAFLGESIPRAGLEAVITAEDSVADGGAQLGRDRASEFDSEVGDAAPGVEDEGEEDGLGGTGGDTAAASAAAVFFRRIGGQFCGGEDFGEEKPVAEGTADEVGVFSDEADAGALSKVSFENGTGVNIPKSGGGMRSLADGCGEGFEFPGEDLVIVGIAGVAGDDASAGFSRRRLGRVLSVVLEVAGCQSDDAANLGQNVSGIESFFLVSFQIGHLSVPPKGEPLGIAPAAGRGRSACDAAGVKTKVRGFGEDLPFGAFRVHGRGISLCSQSVAWGFLFWAWRYSRITSEAIRRRGRLSVWTMMSDCL